MLILSPIQKLQNDIVGSWKLFRARKREIEREDFLTKLIVLENFYTCSIATSTSRNLKNTFIELHFLT